MIKKIAVIVPAYNEEKAIVGVVSDINALDLGKDFTITVVVVNDCSKDNTSDSVRKQNCVLLDLPVNLGIGGAMQTGFIYAFENGFDYAIQVDGDGQHPPSEIPKLVKKIVDAELDIVIGSRFIEKSGFKSTFSRRMGINFFRKVIRLFCGITITDSTSGFRIINQKTLSIVCENYPDEYPEPESIILYHRHHLKIGEVAVEMRERQGGVSSIRMFNSLYYMLKVSIAIVFTFVRISFKK